jgi:anthranilate synthase
VVRRARAAFARGDLFEVVPSQVFSEGCPVPPSELFRRLRARNPAPYGFLVNLGRQEYLVGASPEMFVRVGDPDPRSPCPSKRRRVETCPIAGTIARGRDALEDAEQIQKLLASEKDACELTMCTDVDRNDKSRVCEPGSVRVTARRQIELYSRLIHTVDHVEGTLREGLDALDAFLTHTWAVTVTGAPKSWAMRFIEEHELSPRRFYGGAVGRVGFDGRLDTGLALRTIRIARGIAETRVGATLLYDSDPDEEEAETRLKAAALLDAVRRADAPTARPSAARRGAGAGPRVLLVDCEDSFVHTLGSYFREAGCEVLTLRVGFGSDALERAAPDLVVLSPGPGRPRDFGLDALLGELVVRELPIFGVCLGLQAIAEHFGGDLGVLPEPVHGKASRIRALGGRIFEGLPAEFAAGRYHSLHVRADSLPEALRITARDEEGRIMALEHRALPIDAVQFHPESILTLRGGVGRRLIRNVVAASRSAGRRSPASQSRYSSRRSDDLAWRPE